MVEKQSAGWGKNLIKQHCYVIFHDETLDVGSGEEALGDHVLELLQKRIKKTTCVEQRDGLMMKSELPLAQKLRELFKGTQSPSTSDDAARRCQVRVRNAKRACVTRGEEQAGLRITGLEHFCFAL